MKANSQRVKGKNFRLFNGRPLFAWILDQLLSIDCIDQIVINTDAGEILARNGLSESERVCIRERKAELRGDHVSMNLILEDDIAAVPADTYLMTHTTNPMLSSNTIRKALDAYHDAVACGEADSLFTVNRIQTRFYRADTSPINHNPSQLIQTQDLEPWFEENSNLYIFSAASFARNSARIGCRPIMHVMNKLEAVDIDTEDDWLMAEAIAKLSIKLI
jgi:CMP-N-acetylneuraminic acid synthetase